MASQNPNPTITPMYKVQSPTVFPISARRLLLSFSQYFDVIFRSEHLSIQVIDLLHLISGHPINSEILDVIGEAKDKKELLELIKVILELFEKLRFAKEELRGRRVVEAVEAVRELKVTFGIQDNAVDEEEGRELVVYGSLRNEWLIELVLP